MSADEEPKIEFRKQLFRISNKLTSTDVTNLKFLCGDLLSKRVLEDVKTAFELFSALEGKNQLSPDNLDFLQDLLDAVGKGHLVGDLKRALASPPAPSSSPPRSISPPPSSLTSMKFTTFLVSIGNDLPERDLRNVAYFFQSYNVTGLSAQEVQKLREPARLFEILKQEKIISPTNLGKLKTVMSAIGRKDICEKIDDYLLSVPRLSTAGGYSSSGPESLSDTSMFSFDGSGVQVGGPRPQETMGFKTGTRDLGRPQVVPGVAMEEEQEERSKLLVGLRGEIRRGRSGQQVAMEESPAGEVAGELAGLQVGQPSEQPSGELAGHQMGQPSGQIVGQPSGHASGQPLGNSVGHQSGHQEAMGQPAERPASGHQVGRQRAGHPRPAVGQPPAGQRQPTVDGSVQRTHTQMLQLQLNDKDRQVCYLESQLEHERAHRYAQAEQMEQNVELERELERKIGEVQELRLETSGLRKQLLSGDDSELYPMNTVPPHGKAIIIVNDQFAPNPADPSIELHNRPGAEHDMRLFKETFTNLGYAVEWHANLTAVEMHEVLTAAANEDHDAHDSLVCCVSTHGDEKVMYGSDSIPASRKELVGYIKQSKSLYKKPKMFFLQACRTKPVSPATVTASLTYLPDAAEQDADVFTANASTMNYASYRDHKRGSWFVLALHHVFTKYGYTLTLNEMMHRVNNLVCDAQGYVQDEDPHNGAVAAQEVRQCAETTSSFRFGLRFRFTAQ